MDIERELEQRLSDSPLPDGMLDRLRSIADEGSLTDAEIDARLRQATLPAGWNDRLCEVVEEEALRELLNTAPAPDQRLEQLAVELRKLPFEKRESRIARWAIAASLIFLLFGAQWGAIGGMLAAIRSQDDHEVDLLVVDQGPLELTSPTERIVLAAPRTNDEQPIRDEQPMEALNWLVTFEQPTTGIVDQLITQFTADGSFHDDVFLLKWGFLGAPSVEDDVPELMTVSLPRARGVEPPLVRGYDRKFLLRERCSPPISPAAHPQLRVAKAPLTTITGSYDLTRRAAENERFPDERDVRIEDFLAAMPYEFAPPSQGLSLAAAAGPSRFSGNGPGLLQIGVQAAGLPNRRPVHLTVALDISASMQWASQLDRTRLAVSRLLRHLTEDDRLTIVAFADEPLTLVEQASPLETTAIKRMLSRLQPRGGTNLAAGLQQAVAEAFRDDSGQRSNLLLVVTDAGDVLDDQTLRKVESLLGQATSGGLALAMFDWTRGEASSMEGCMVRCGGDYQRVEADSLGWQLVESLAERSSLIAKDAKLTVEFNPKAVAFYRMIGHHTDALAGLSALEPAAQLRALESATALFEIGLKPGGERRVAVAKLEWKDAAGRVRKRQRVIQRDLFVSTFAGAPPEFQAATLAAETAEIVGRNYFGQNQTRNLREVLRAVESVHPDLNRRAEFAEFVDLLRKLEEIRIRRGTR